MPCFGAQAEQLFERAAAASPRNPYVYLSWGQMRFQRCGSAGRARDVFARGMPEMVIIEKRNSFSASLYDLLTAYAQQRQRQAINNVTIARRAVWSLKDAREVLARLVGSVGDWTALDSFLIEYLAAPEEKRTAIASSFAATLEMVREGKLEVRQEQVFAPIYLRGRAQGVRAVEVVS